MILRHPRGSWLAAGVIVLWAGLAPPALASHVAPADTKDAQAGPLKLGVSGSSQTFLLIKNVLYCYAGTLGSLVQDSVADRYILSNNHVLAKENGKLAYGDAGRTRRSSSRGCSTKDRARWIAATRRMPWPT